MITNQLHHHCLTLASRHPGLEIKTQHCCTVYGPVHKVHEVYIKYTHGGAHTWPRAPDLWTYVRSLFASLKAYSLEVRKQEAYCTSRIHIILLWKRSPFLLYSYSYRAFMKSTITAGNLGKDERDAHLPSGFSPPLWSGDRAILSYPLAPFCPTELSVVMDMSCRLSNTVVVTTAGFWALALWPVSERLI